jgi:hypothetical protein
MVLLLSAAGKQKFKQYIFTLQISPLITIKNSAREKKHLRISLNLLESHYQVQTEPWQPVVSKRIN